MKKYCWLITLFVGLLLFIYPTNAKPTITEIERQVHKQVNDYRVSKKLPKLVWNNDIAQKARGHSKNMASKRVKMSHDGFDARIDAISEKIKLRSAAENVGFNWNHPDPAKSAVKGWINSKGHRKNMVGNYKYTGIGVAVNSKNEYYFTQIFVK